ncbi:MAG: inositol monophosphatase [Firmicutes bacterium]|nr:inositol monophosphatase [Bacillota bacterium]
MDFEKIIDLVKSARNIIAEQSELHIETKGEADFVTAVDFAISDFLKAELQALTPEIGFLSEEEEGKISDACWILDPIDGTTNLIYGYNLSSVSLGLYINGEIIFGVVYNPFTDELFTAEKGKGAFLNGKRLQVSSRQSHEALIEFGAECTHKENAEKNFRLACEIFCHCVDLRRICSSALDLCYIAAGRIDGYFEKLLKPWDIAAGSLILQEAGGRISDFAGEPLQFALPSSVIAGNTATFEYLLQTIKKHEV